MNKNGIIRATAAVQCFSSLFASANVSSSSLKSKAAAEKVEKGVAYQRTQKIWTDYFRTRLSLPKELHLENDMEMKSY